MPLRLLLEAVPLCWVGRISYGVYLWHVPVFLIAKDSPLPGRQRTIIILAFTFAVASLSYYVMERPILRLKDRIGHPSSGRTNRHTVAPAAALAHSY